MRRILFIATVIKHFKAFYLPYFEQLKNDGWQVDCACSGYDELPNCDNVIQIDIARNPFSTKNIHALGQVRNILLQGRYDIIHCGTPMGGIIARIAQIKTKKPGAKVIYTAHGFHFFKGAPLINWMLYFPLERMLSRITDCLITINSEDYRTAKKYLKAGGTAYVHGVGYDNIKFVKPASEEISKLRSVFGYSDEDLLLIYVAEINKNKNQKMLLEAMLEIKKAYPAVRLLLIGQDITNGKLKIKAEKLGIADDVVFYGHRNDVSEILPMCDIAVASSFREGLPVNIMESLACGIPVVATDNRGHRELIKNGENGFLVKPDSPSEMAGRVIELAANKQLYLKLSQNASNGVKIYGVDRVLEEVKAVYAGI